VQCVKPLHCVQVQNAITRQKKEAIVSDLKENLQNSAIVFGIRFKGLDVSGALTRYLHDGMTSVNACSGMNVYIHIYSGLSAVSRLSLVPKAHCVQSQQSVDSPSEGASPGRGP
jgi:hypothetical protein